MSSVGVFIDVNIFDAEKTARINDKFGVASKFFVVTLIDIDWYTVVAFFGDENFDFNVAGTAISVI